LPLNKIFVVIVLLFATISLFKSVQRYQPTGPELLRNNNFEKGLVGWSRRGGEGTINIASGVIALKNLDASQSVEILQVLDEFPEQKSLLMTAEISTENLKTGSKYWHYARVDLFARNAQGKYLYKKPHNLARIMESIKWKQFSNVFNVADNVSELVVKAQLARSTGIMRVRNLSLLPVTTRYAFTLAKNILLVIWCVALVWIAIPAVSGIGFNMATGSLCFVVLTISVAILIPDSAIDKFQNTIPTAYPEFLPTLSIDDKLIGEMGQNKLEYLRELAAKGIHFLLFFAASLVAQFAWPLSHGATRFIYLIIFAAVTEVLQFFAIGRSPSLEDWLINASGILLAFTLLWVFNRIRKSIEA